MIKPPLLLHGMHGLGDNLHQRAIVRELLPNYEVWLTTPWPQLYWDLPELHLRARESAMCWMAKNEIRLREMYDTGPPPAHAGELRCAYPPAQVQAAGSVLGAMARGCGVGVGDFRLPVAPQWNAKADALLWALAPRKPLMIYRPPVAIAPVNCRPALAKVARNPDLAAYHALVSAIRERFYVISVADLMLGQEWLVGPQLEVDAAFHHGELDVETLAALTARAALVFCSPGFMTVLAQAVGTPMVCVFGGFEAQASFAPGARFSPWLPIEPKVPCACWDYQCKHDKTIDLPAARARLQQFVEGICSP